MHQSDFDILSRRSSDRLHICQQCRTLLPDQSRCSLQGAHGSLHRNAICQEVASQPRQGPPGPYPATKGGRKFYSFKLRSSEFSVGPLACSVSAPYRCFLEQHQAPDTILLFSWIPGVGRSWGPSFQISIFVADLGFCVCQDVHVAMECPSGCATQGGCFRPVTTCCRAYCIKHL